MDPNVFAGRWKEIRGKAKLEWGKLTDDDLEQIDGKIDMLIGAIQRRYGYTRDNARSTVEDWLARLGLCVVHQDIVLKESTLTTESTIKTSWRRVSA